jgi:hypothetical protein
MPTASRKQMTKRTPAQQAARQMRTTQRVQRAVRHDHTPTGEKRLEEIIADHSFGAQAGDIPAEEIEIDPQFDESERVEP